jgi:hypothetical protein
MPYELEDMLARKREVTFTFYGKEMHADYYVEKMTENFRAELLRMMRLSMRLQQRGQKLAEIVEKVDEEIDTIEAAAEDANAESALAQFKADDTRVKQQIDVMLADLLISWDVLDHGKPYPISAENLFPVPGEFLGRIIAAILEDSKGLGEQIGKSNITKLPTSSSPKGKRVRSPRRRIG